MALIMVERDKQLLVVPSQQVTLTGRQEEMMADSDQLQGMVQVMNIVLLTCIQYLKLANKAPPINNG